MVLELLGIRNTPSLSSLPDPLWPGVVDPHRILSMGQTELNSGFGSLLFFSAFKLRTNVKLK